MTNEQFLTNIAIGICVCACLPLLWAWTLEFIATLSGNKISDLEYQEFLHGLTPEQRMQWAMYKLQYEQGARTHRELADIRRQLR